MFAVLIAWLVLGELPTAVQLLGGVLIVAGVTLVRIDELLVPDSRSDTADEHPRPRAQDRPAITCP
jgi:drug/metabolite transporter (DMT)-like permease